MILKELNLISFGKFHNKIINLDKGLNIIYGENESGKTTVHNFIDGMFYGFLKPYAKRRNYLEGLDKYRPWNEKNYAGNLILSQDGRDYRVERDFNKGKVKVYDNLVGIDITKEIDNGEKIKDNLPGVYFFDFNNMVYNNTISIRQLENKIESDLSKEIGDRLANISTSLDDDISVKDAINKLDKKLDNIGTERAYTKPYGKAIRDLGNLESLKKELLQNKEEYHRQVLESAKLKEKIEMEEDTLKELSNKLDQLEILEKREICEDALNIESRLKEIDIEIMDLERYRGLSFEDYTLAIELNKDIKHMDQEISKLNSNLEEIETQLEIAISKVEENSIDGIHAEELYSDLEKIDIMEDEKNNIVLSREQNKLDLLNSELKAKSEREKNQRNSMIIFFILSLISLGVVFVNPLFIPLPVVLAGIGFIRRSSYSKTTSDLEKLKVEIGNIEKNEKEKNKRLIDIESLQNQILKKYSCNTKIELKRLKEDIYFQDRNSKIKEEEIKRLKENREKIILALENNKINIQSFKTNLMEIKNNNSVKDLEDFKIGLDKKRKYEELIQEKNNKIEILEKTLGNNTLEEIQLEVGAYNYEDLVNVKDEDKLSLMGKIDSIKNNLQEYKEINSRLDERIDNLNKDVKKILTIEEKIERLKIEIVNYENQIKSINIARDTIEKISTEIHHQFAPSINKEISEIIQIISNDKYKDVKVDEDLNISIENPETYEIVPVDSLSGGTMDQLYFALRFSIISSIKGQSLPLILDDCFIQYDNGRLENVIKYLYEISDNRQIILFTCHKREIEILEKLDLKYNLIEL